MSKVVDINKNKGLLYLNTSSGIITGIEQSDRMVTLADKMKKINKLLEELKSMSKDKGDNDE